MEFPRYDIYILLMEESKGPRRFTYSISRQKETKHGPQQKVLTSKSDSATARRHRATTQTGAFSATKCKLFRPMREEPERENGRELNDVEPVQSIRDERG